MANVGAAWPVAGWLIAEFPCGIITEYSSQFVCPLCKSSFHEIWGRGCVFMAANPCLLKLEKIWQHAQTW